MESQPFVGISKGLQPENRLWRYMSLDKLIDLLSTRSLYMSPVTQFEATDVDIVPVKYLDFDREYVPTELKDFRGRITATKRLAYQHEQEVRLTIRPVTQNPMDWEQTDFGQPNPIRLPIDVNKLIHEIRVSPYPAAPFESSVRSVCQMFGVNGGCIQTSSLLRYKRASISEFLTLQG